MSPEKPEVTQDEQKKQAQNDQTNTAKETEVKKEVSQETDQERNWKKFREIREQERKKAEQDAQRAAEREAEAAALKLALDAALNKSQPQNHSVYDELDDTEDQRIEKKVNALLAKREAEADERRKQHEMQTLPTRIKQALTDFDSVCSAANYDYLEYHHPELARSLGRQPDSVEKYTDIYNAIKRYVPNLNHAQEQKKAESNFNKPQAYTSSTPQPAVGSGATIRIDEARKQANWLRMKQTMGKID
jgi:hypothetical protein